MKEYKLTPEEYNTFYKEIKNLSILRRFLRYDQAVLEIPEIRAVPKPFLMALLLRLIAPKRAIIRSEKEQIDLTLKQFLKYGKRFVLDPIEGRRILKETEKSIQALYETRRSPLRDLASSMHLRTDQTFGIKAGGSVAHFGGVLNSMSRKMKVSFVTNSHLPGLSEQVKVYLVRPDEAFWHLRDFSYFPYHFKIYQRALDIAKKEKPSFIYQRYSLGNITGVSLARKLRIPFVLEFNSSEIWIKKNWNIKPLRYEELQKSIEQVNVKLADLITVVSQPLKDFLIEKYQVNEDRILVNPNGVDPERCSPEIDGSSIRKKYNLEGKKVFGFIGVFGVWHGVEKLAEAFSIVAKRHKEARLLLIGDGALRQKVEDFVKKNGLSEKAVFTGIVPYAEGPKYLAACDFLVSPHVPNKDGSKFFGSPTKLFEYMAMGKPIIASNLDQIGEILEDRKTALLAEPGNSESLAEKMSWALDHLEEVKAYGRAARKEVLAKHTWDQHVQRILSALERVQKLPLDG